MSDGDNTAQDAALAEHLADLEPTRADMERGCFFIHGLCTQNRREVRKWYASLTALVEDLAESGLVDLESLNKRENTLRETELKTQYHSYICRVGPRVDKYRLTDLPDIDCFDLLPICRAACCRYTHLLSMQDLDEGEIEWEVTRPYELKFDASGCCKYNSPTTHQCSIYDKRLVGCRSYDCRTDPRIWLDFEQRIRAPEHDDWAKTELGGVLVPPEHDVGEVMDTKLAIVDPAASGAFRVSDGEAMDAVPEPSEKEASGEGNGSEE